MHQYSLDTKIRKTIFFIIIIISVIISLILNTLLEGTMNSIEDAIESSKIILRVFKFIHNTKLIPSIIGVPLIYSGLYTIFDKLLWKCKIINKILGVPNLNGIWKGKIHSSYDDKDYTMELTIKQTWTKIQCESKFEASTSNSNVAAIYLKGIEGCTLYFGFHNQSNDVKISTPQYDGYNILMLKGTELSGKYFNNRPNLNDNSKSGNLGTVKLTKKAKKEEI